MEERQLICETAGKRLLCEAGGKAVDDAIKMSKRGRQRIASDQVGRIHFALSYLISTMDL